PLAVGAISEIATTMAAVAEIVLDALYLVRASIMTTIHGIGGLGAVIEDVVTGNFSAIVGDAKTAAAKVGDEWNAIAVGIQSNWEGLAESFAHPLGGDTRAGPQPPKPVGEDEPSGDTKHKKKHDTRL